VPTWRKLDSLLLDLAVGIAPVQIDGQWAVCCASTQSHMNVRTALTRLTVAAIDYANQRAPVGELNCGQGTNRWATKRVRSWLAGADDGLALLINGQQQVQPKKVATLRAIIAIEARGRPLIGHGKIKVAVTIDIGGGDATGDLRFSNANVGSQINVAATGAAHKETVVQDGQLSATNYHQYPMAMLMDTPTEINVILMEGDEKPSGVG